MRIRMVDADGNWLYGKGANDYVTKLRAVILDINTRLLEFLGDCFFNLGAGIDWFNLLGSKDPLTINLTVGAVILNTANVTGIKALSVSLDVKRRLTVVYEVITTFSSVKSKFSLDLNPIG